MLLSVTVFVLVYLGMVLGGLPGLAIDRAGLALLGALALLALEAVSPQAARDAVDIPTIALLFGLMVVSAQLRLGGFYGEVTRRIGGAALTPPSLLAVVMLVAGTLSALLTNDIICLAMTPLLVEACGRRGLNPIPHLLGLACAANIGSAATLIGNPQNILIGEALHLSFRAYAALATPIALGGLAIAWGVIALFYRSRWQAAPREMQVDTPPFNRWQATKGLAVMALVVLAFMATTLPRELVALGAAGVLLISRRMHSRDTIALVDWHLLVLFISLFIVNHAFAASGALAQCLELARGAGIQPEHPAALFTLAAVLSNLVSNVPAVMLLLPAATGEQAGAVLCLASTLAGNFVVVASIANIIVVEQARPLGVEIGWREHAAVGVPVTALTLALAGAVLYLV